MYRPLFLSFPLHAGRAGRLRLRCSRDGVSAASGSERGLGGTLRFLCFHKCCGAGYALQGVGMFFPRIGPFVSSDFLFEVGVAFQGSTESLGLLVCFGGGIIGATFTNKVAKLPPTEDMTTKSPPPRLLGLYFQSDVGRFDRN